ncbi:MAG: tRNA (adenosine(37)-N6)-threonylcarbamoyltransferase complex dimerization subunit type 1 TsaB [Planctomycetes bacterium]|nr:tRNA (adenosine(37)-N6)-threonylcarbamoyltransferase complex dimerization subunit type 1 TsaB [Planctomycetota bacterium]
MNTIAIETSSTIGSVACVANGRVMYEQHFRRGLLHGRDLMVELDHCIAEVEWKRSDIELIAVSVGPGSYTGLRVGVAAAKALSYALRVDVAAVCSLDVIAENGPRTADHVAVVLDARRDQVYGASYSNVGFSFFREEGPLLASPEEFAASLPRPAYLLGDALRRYESVFDRRGFEMLPEAAWRPRAMKLGLLGEKAYLVGEKTDPATLLPIYLRLPEAEEKWQRAHGGGADS